MGCKGPFTWNNCTTVEYNQDISFHMRAGHGCIGCSQPAFWDRMTPFEKPNADAKIILPMVEATADEFGVALLGAAGAGIAAHAIYTGVKKKRESKKTSEKKKSDSDKNDDNNDK